jgi:alpha-amylase/alpha-mannosidase (GH57 family)
MDLAILWHFHQPIYRRPASRDYVLPWVNFHMTKNYYQMARLTEEFEFPCTFNFAPCLLEQIEDYAQAFARDPWQSALETNPERLNLAEIKMLQKFAAGETDKSKLQLKALKSFFSPVDETKADKNVLLGLQKDIWKKLLPLYGRLWKESKIELTTSAYYHPLLPLIFDLRAAGEESPPSVSFRYPEDGDSQIRKGRSYFRQIFGAAPQGLWPSEGGISQPVARAIAANGFSFAVTDENVLWKSLREPCDPKKLFEPYACENLAIFFRDRELSDLLGFEYQRWNEKEAVRDFSRRLEERSRLAGDSGIVVLALDGENPWGTYPENGVPFLREFFGTLKSFKGVAPVFFADHLVRRRRLREIDLVPGTWLGNFSKWTGNPAKNAGWKTLSRAREACGPRQEIYIAQGSDWFWWFGEENTEEFSGLFRSYIEEAYRQSGIPIP